MKRFSTKGIVLRRLDYGEGDRIVTFLTPDQGALGVMAKGVRKAKSKLAGGIELFSVSDITLLEGRGELYTLISSRLDTHYRHIIEEYKRVELGYEAIAKVYAVASQFDDNRLFSLLVKTFAALDEPKLPLALVELWFKLNFLALLGQQPDLIEDADGHRLLADANYQLDPAEAVLRRKENGELNAEHIKTWRLLLSTEPERALRIKGTAQAAEESIEPLRKLFGYQTS